MSGLYEQLQDNSMNQNPHIIQHEIEEVVSVVPQDPRVQAHGQLPDGRVHTVHRVHRVHHILRVHGVQRVHTVHIILRVQTVSLHQQECEQRAEEGQQGSHHQGGCAVSCARVLALVTCHVSPCPPSASGLLPPLVLPLDWRVVTAQAGHCPPPGHILHTRMHVTRD